MRRCHYTAISGWCLVLLLSACVQQPTAPGATVEYDHSYNFSKVHKIAIQSIPRDTLGTMMISDTQISRINLALTTELQRRGFEVVTKNADADMYLSWKFTPQESDEVATFDPANQNITQGTLYVNMIDPLLLQSEWRSTFHADLRDQPESETAAQYRLAAAQAVLAQFPPGTTGH